MSPARPPEPSAPVGEWQGGQVTVHAHCLLQGNPGPMTLDGTNTWVLIPPGGSEAIVVDPGEDEAAHQQRVVDHPAVSPGWVNSARRALGRRRAGPLHRFRSERSAHAIATPSRAMAYMMGKSSRSSVAVMSRLRRR